jgi:hypothetical protein
MLIRDFSTVDEAWNGAVERIFTSALHAALALYNGVLAKAAPRTIGCSAEVLREASGILSGIRLLGALPQVIQDLFMYFGRFHYRVDLKRFSRVSWKKSGLGQIPKAQEAGLLYVETCLPAVVPGGRVGILVPNGYLGNRSERYLGFRRWLVRHARIAAVIGFPRFTFKKSGADVSASAGVWFVLRSVQGADARPGDGVGRPVVDLCRRHLLHRAAANEVGSRTWTDRAANPRGSRGATGATSRRSRRVGCRGAGDECAAALVACGAGIGTE